MAIIENGLFPKLSGEDIVKFKAKAEARANGTDGLYRKKIREGLQETLEFFSGKITTKQNAHLK